MATKKASKAQASSAAVKQAQKKNANVTPKRALQTFLDKYVNKPKTGSPVGPRLEALIKAIRDERLQITNRIKALDEVEAAAKKFKY